MALKIHPDMKDELPGLAMAGLNLMATLRGHGGGNGRHVDGDGRPVMSAISAIVAFAIRFWEENGGSKKDESEMLESLFNDTTVTKSEKLTAPERKKVAAVMKCMEPGEKKVFLVAIMLMDPEERIVNTLEEKKDGKVIKGASTHKEKTGVDPRINVLRGIAELVNDDLGNAEDVVKTLRGTGTLGSDNWTIKFLVRVQIELKKLLCAFFGVESIELITFDMVKEKATVLIGKIGVPNANLPGPPVGPLMRVGRLITPGSYRNAPAPKSVKAKKEVKSTSLLKTFAVVAGIIAIVSCGSYFGASKYRAYQRDIEINNIINAYQPTKPSAGKLTK